MNKIQSLTFLNKCLEKVNNSTKEEIARFKEIYFKECSNMLKIINITSKNDIINMEVLIEGDIANKYKLCVNSNDDVFPVIDSEIPDEYKIYERQARIALRQYPDKIFPDYIVSSWY